MRKNCYSDREKLLKFKAEGQEFAECLRSLEKFIQIVKQQFWNWKNILGFRNMQEKLEKSIEGHKFPILLLFQAEFVKDKK